MQVNWGRITCVIAVVVAGFVGYWVYPLSHQPVPPDPVPIPGPPTPPPPPPIPPPDPASTEIVVPAAVTGNPGRQIAIVSKGTAPWIEWHLLDKPVEGLPLPIDITPLDKGTTVIFTAPDPGTYYLEALADSKTQTPNRYLTRSVVKVTIGTPPPVPPGPGPGPVPPPVPVDPFMAALQAAWAADADPAKASERDILQGMYQTYAASVPTNITTYGDLFKSMSAVRKAILPTDPLLAERQAIEKYLNDNLPTDGTKPVDKAVTAKAFGTVAIYLGQLK
jgi:hypothetical protein